MPKSKPADRRVSRDADPLRPTRAGLRQRIYDIIFEADTPAGKAFDIALLIAIVASIAVASLETLQRWQDSRSLWIAEQFLTLLFTLEYVARLSCVRSSRRYAFSFWGIIDLLSFLPSYLIPLLGGTGSFVILRSVRLLRVFRVLKLWRMMSEADELGQAVWRARDKIIVFLCVVLVAVTISGTLMYHVEEIGAGDESEFTSIPQAMYWAVVSLTTVGYGDVVPRTSLGKMISTALILLGYSLIIVPSTFVTSEMVRSERQPCAACGSDTQKESAKFCDQCGTVMTPRTDASEPPDVSAGQN